MKTKYPTSKYVLVCASIVAFTGIASWVSVHGPFGRSTASAQTTTQTQQADQPPVIVRQRRYSDDGDSQTYTITVPGNSYSNSAPLARSRGS
jgi:hypothetical protein